MTNEKTHEIDPIEWQAYLDGELDDDARARVAVAISTDPALADRLARDLRLQARVRDAFADVLEEPVPGHLHAMLAVAAAPQASADPPSQSPGDTNIVVLQSRSTHRRIPPAWLGYAAAAVLAVVAIGGAWQHLQSPVRMRGGELVAGGALARGLDHALASAPETASTVSIGLTFRARDGRVCRSFRYRGDAALSGLACRDDDAWRLSALDRIDAASEGEWRQASSAMTPAVQAAVDAALVGDAFDAEAERASRASGWR
ncbi:MAG: hypothetical protein KF800_08510 [Lysobacter sp.]|nr:hypothetical protein [Lysobacter sp.]